MAGDERQPHLARWSWAVRPGGEGENAFMHIPDGGSGQVTYYPLKPHAYVSGRFSWAVSSFNQTCSQVFTTKLVNPFFLFNLMQFRAHMMTR